MQGIDHAANPFPGLRPFESCETHLFFGRDGQSDELLRRLKRTRFLAVVGTSGSGKSSLVRAGLLPGLQGGLMASAGSDWRIAILRPGGDPVGNLARALTSPAVLGAPNEKDADMPAVLAETTLRRSSLGLVELVTRACTKPDEKGQPLFHDYENLLVVVDQFEELFRFKQLIEEENSKEDAAAFVKLLLEAVGHNDEKRIYVVLTMRSDFLGDCSQFWGLPEAINNGQYLIPRMTRDERRAAISGPVAVGQGAISEPLVNHLLNDVGDNPDQLPILQHALMRTWDYWLSHRSNGNPLDIPDYNAIGGMAEALSRHADEAYAELNERQQAIAEKLFKGLTEKGADNREIRNPMEVQEICELTEADESEVIAVIEAFRREGRSFLVPPPTDALTGTPVHLNRGSLIDISHESLIRNWARLKSWVDEEAQSARIYRRLAETAMLHHAGEEALLMDPALQGALDWREKNDPNVIWARRYHPEFATATRYLDASVAARDAERQEDQKRQRREVSYRRTRFVALILALSVLLSLASAAYAFRQGAVAGRQRIIAEQNAAEADRQKQLAEQQTEFATAARKDAVAAGKRAKDEETKAKDESIRAAHQAELARVSERLASKQTEFAIREKRKADEAALRNRRLAYAADINLTQQAYESGNLEWARDSLRTHTSAAGDSPGFEWDYLWHQIHSEKDTWKAPSEGLITVVASPVGTTVAIGAGQKVELRNISNGQMKSKTVIDLPDDFDTGSLAFSPDGKTLAVGSARGSEKATVIFYDTATKKIDKPFSSFRERTDSANSLTFSADGKTLIVGGGDGSVSLWDVDSPLKPAEIPDLEGTINLAVSVDGTLAIGSVRNKKETETTSARRGFPVSLFEMSTRKRLGNLAGHAGSVTAVAFAPNGETLATGSTDKTVRLWHVKDRRILSIWPFASQVFSVAFSPDGKFLAIGYEDGSIKVCDAKGTQECANLRGHHEAVISLSFSAGGEFLFSSDSKYIPNDESIRFERSEGTRIKSWDVATLLREQMPVAHVRGREIGTFGYTPDSKSLAVIGGDYPITLLDAETNKQRFRPETDLKTNGSIALSPGGTMIATGSSTVTLWNTSTGKRIGKPLPHERELHEQKVLSVAFSPDSKQLATVTLGGTVRLWDTTSQKIVAKLRDEGNHNSGKIERSVRVTFSPDGKRLALLYGDVVELWDSTLAKRLHQFNTASQEHYLVRTMAFSPTGEVLAIGSSGTVVILDAQTLVERTRFKAGTALALAFSPNGKILVTGGAKGMLKLWDWSSSRELIKLTGHTSEIQFIAFSPDGKKLATSDDEALRVWHAPPEANRSVDTKPSVTSSSWRTSYDLLSPILNAGWLTP